MTGRNLQIFALSESAEFAARVCSDLDAELSPHEEREFEDGEQKIRPLCSVRGNDLYVIQSLYSDARKSVNDKLCRLLFFLGALRDAGAERITAVSPYLCYARKDRKTKPRDPVTIRYLAALLEAVGTNRVVTLDVHNLAAYQNAFRCLTEHLEGTTLFADYIRRRLAARDRVAVVSPDVGGIKRAEAFRLALAAINPDAEPPTMAFVEKYRSAGVISGKALVGDVQGRTAILIDDLISSGTTLAKAADACRAGGASAVYAVATHALFSRNAYETLQVAPIDQLVVTDSVNHERAAGSMERLHVLTCAPFLAQAINRLHTDGSIVDLLGG